MPSGLRRTESDSEIVHIPYSEAYGRGFEDMRRRVPDTDRIQGLLDWHPQISLEQTLARVRDDLQRRDGYNVADSALTWMQIKAESR